MLYTKTVYLEAAVIKHALQERDIHKVVRIEISFTFFSFDQKLDLIGFKREKKKHFDESFSKKTNFDQKII